MQTISIEVLVKAEMAAVWHAWTTPEDINQWNAASDDWHTPKSRNDLKVGGTFCYRMEAKDGSAGFDFEGTYTKVVPNACIEYVLGDDRAVSITFEDTGDGIRLMETFEAEDIHTAEQQRDGWQSILENFARHVESKNPS